MGRAELRRCSASDSSCDCRGSEYYSYVVLTLVDVNLDGVSGWVAEFCVEDKIRAGIETAVDEAEASFNAGIASEIAAAQDRDEKGRAILTGGNFPR